MNFSLFFRSIGHALHGARSLWRNEQNIRIQVFVGLLAIVLSFVFPLEVWKRIIVVLLVGMVLAIEAINSVFERIVDLVKPRLHPSVQDMKDIMAAAVLMVSAAALLIGMVIFLPYIIPPFTA